VNRDFRATFFTIVAMGICILLQSTILGRVAIRGVRPDLAMLVLVFVSLRRGPMVGQVSGFVSGFLEDLMNVSPLGFHSLLRTVIGYFFGLLSGNVFIDPFLMPIILAVVATLAMGAAVGLINGLLITKLRIAPFIVTLGAYSILRGVGYTVATMPVGKAAPGFLRLYDLKVGPVPLLVLFLALLTLAGVFVLRRTAFGRYIYAIGGNEQVARLSGIRVDWVKIGVYVLCSTLAALTGLLYLTRAGVGDPVIGEGAELQAITAVILGGTSLFGGQGGLIGTLGGVLLMGLTNNVLVILNVSSWYQDLIQGLVIVGAVALYKQKRR